MTPLRVWVGCLAFVAGTTVASACAGDGARPDPNTVSPCAEVDNPPPGCE